MGKQIDHNSFWVIKQNPITKIGVFPYLGRQISPELEPNKIYQVLRPESELFAAEALASFNELPITIGHALLGPREEGFTPAEEKGIDGTTGTTAERKGDKIVNDIKLFSERIKDEVNHGKKELSAGYFCDFVPERGTWNGRHYDFVQKNIRGNHIALVDKGRSGHDVRVMDSAEGTTTRQFVCDAMDLTGKFEEKFLKRALEQNKPELAKEKKWRIKKLKEAIKGLKSSRYGYGWDLDLSSKNHGNSGLDAATGKEMTMEQLKKAIEEIKALFANPEEGDKDAKLAEIISGLKEEPAADDKCATDEDVDKRKLIDEIGGILNGKVDEEIRRTVLKKAEEIAYNDSTAETADDEEETEEDEEETEEKKDKKVASLDEMEKALLARLSRKAEMVKQLTPIIGAFDSADMTEKEVAAYACKKLNLSAAMDEAPAVVKGYLAGRAKNDVRVTFGAKAKTSAQDEILNNFKEGK